MKWLGYLLKGRGPLARLNHQNFVASASPFLLGNCCFWWLRKSCMFVVDFNFAACCHALSWGFPRIPDRIICFRFFVVRPSALVHRRLHACLHFLTSAANLGTPWMDSRIDVRRNGTPEFSVCDYLTFKRLLEQAFGGHLKEYTFKTADHKLPLKCNEIHEGFKQWSVMQNTPAFAHGRRVVQDWYCIITSYKHLKWVSLKSAKTIWQMWKRHEKTRTETTWWDAEQHWPVFWHCSQAFLGNIKARDPCRAMARICLRRKFQAGASVVHLVKCTQVQEHIFTVICLMRYMNYISYYARLRHPEALVIGTGPMPLFRPLGLVYLASREHSCRGLKQHHA